VPAPPFEAMMKCVVASAKQGSNNHSIVNLPTDTLVNFAASTNCYLVYWRNEELHHLRLGG
jgi:hypothetical protein